MIYFFKFIFLFIIYLNQAYSNELVNLRFGSNGEIKRIVLDLTEDISFDSKVYDKKIEIFFKAPIDSITPPKIIAEITSQIVFNIPFIPSELNNSDKKVISV